MFSLLHMLLLVPGILFPQRFHGQISLILQGTQLRRYFRQEVHQIDPLSGQEPLLDHRGPMAFHHHRSNYSGSVYPGHTSPEQAHDKYWRSEIRGERGEFWVASGP